MRLSGRQSTARGADGIGVLINVQKAVTEDRVILALCLSLLFQDVVEQVAVDYVLVDVTVTDKNGQPVTDIKPTEFRVRDGRNQVELSHFEVLDLRQGAVRSIMEAELDPIEQTMILTLDFALSDLETARATLRDLERFFDGRRHHQPVQMFLYSLDTGPISRGFSTDPDTLIDALVQFEGELERYFEERGSLLGFSMVNLEKEMRSCFPGGIGNNLGTPSNQANASQVVMPCIESLQKNYSQRHMALASARLQRLEKFMLFWQRIAGPKQLYMISQGLPKQPGAEAANLARAFTNYRNAMQSGAFGNINAAVYTESSQPFSAPHFQLNPTDSLATGSELKSDFERLADLALATRCTVHTFYIPPDENSLRETLNMTREQNEETLVNQAHFARESNLGEGLREIAELTGGMTKRVSDLGAALDGTLFDSRYSYVLAWPKPKKEGRKFRRIKIDIDRPGLLIEHRKGYLPKRLKNGKRKRR